MLIENPLFFFLPWSADLARWEAASSLCMHAHRVEGENEAGKGRVLIFDGVGDSYGIPRKVMMATQARGGIVLDMSLIGYFWEAWVRSALVCLRAGRWSWAFLARFQRARDKGAFIQREVNASGNGYGL